jgi:hypothetical protein
MILELLKDPALKTLQGEIRAELAAWPRTRAIPDAAARLDEAIAQWTNSLIFGELLKDTARPSFLWATDDTPRDWLGHHLGGVGTSGDNPDNVYRTAGIEGGGRYEILGQYHPESRPTQVLIEVHNVDLAKPNTMMTPTATADGKGSSPDPHASAQIDDRAFVVDGQGRFRITLGSGEPDPSWASPNHLRIPDKGFCSVGARDLLADWKLRPTGLAINRLDRVDAPAFGIEQVRKLMLEDLAGYIRFWAHFPEIWFRGLKPNTHSSPQQRPGGWGFVAGVNYHLADDEAMVIVTSDGGAKYTGFQLNDPWMIQPDVRSRQVCLNGSQVTKGADGTVTYVLALKDPGAANWIDTAGLHDGLCVVRWQVIPEGLDGNTLIRDFKVVKLSELAAMKDLPRVTPAERKAAVAKRKGDYETRVR